MPSIFVHWVRISLTIAENRFKHLRFFHRC